MSDSRKLIFIACGQRTEKEKAMGSKLEVFINNCSDLRAFLAESAHDLSSLTSNIFENLNKCSGFIAILHKRNNYSRDIFSSSVWINQEIAIASFLRHTHNRNIPVLIFEEKDILREGVLEYLHTNPIPFINEQEVLDRVRQWVESTAFSTIQKSEFNLDAHSLIRNKTRSQAIHDYSFTLHIKNTGKRTIRQFSFDLLFPREIIITSDPKQFFTIDYESWRHLGYTEFKNKLKFPDILPGKDMPVISIFDFQINSDIYHSGATHKEIIWKIYADDMEFLEIREPLEGKNRNGTDRINF